MKLHRLFVLAWAAVAPFNGVFAAEETPPPAAAAFSPRVVLPVAQRAHSVFSDDVNVDGIPDLIMATAGTNEVAVMLGQGKGSFGKPRYFGAGSAPKFAVTGDFNSDGQRDIVVAEQDSNSIGLLLGHGDGTFGRRRGYASCAGDHEIVVADFNGDAKDDAAVACWGNENVISLFLGNGSGGFEPRRDLPVGDGPLSVGITDLDADGRIDIVVSNSDESTVSVLMNTGDGEFEKATNYPTDKAPQTVRALDLDLDGHPDIATANGDAGTVSILWGRADGFEPHVDMPALAKPRTIGLADLNGDSLPDVLVTNTNYPDCCTKEGSTLRVFINAGNRHFLPPQDFAVGGNPFSLAIADLNGDGKVDVATADYLRTPDAGNTRLQVANLLDAGTKRALATRVAIIGALCLLIVVATWRRHRVAGLLAAVVIGVAMLLLMFAANRYVREGMSDVSILMAA